jgi:hypothetical protein
MLTKQEVIELFEKAKKHYRPRKWWEFWRITTTNSELRDGFCSYFYNHGIFSYDSRILETYWLPYKTRRSHGGYHFNNHQERYDTCIKILNDLKNEN